MEDKIFFCKSNQLAKYLINNGCTNINKNNNTYEFIKNEKLTSEYIYPRLQEFFKENDCLLMETGIKKNISFSSFYI